MIDGRAIVDTSAVIGENVTIGPWTLVGPGVEIGDNVHIASHVVLKGPTRVGAGVRIFQFATVGEDTPAFAFAGEETFLEIGENTVIREGVTIHRGMAKGGIGRTEVGKNCLLMAYVHVAHDCVVGDNVIIANASQLAGHVEIEDHVVFGGMTTVHQFVRVGTRAFTGARTHLVKDVPPYMMADGHPAHLFGPNKVGLERAGLESETIRALKDAYKSIFMRGPYAEAVAAASSSHIPEVARLARFLQTSERGVTRPRNQRP